MPRCDHCLRDFSAREAVYSEIDGQRKVFCCNGCSGIFRLIHSEGLDGFYAKRKWDETGIEASLFDKEIDICPFEENVRDSGQFKETDILIDGVRCASCIWLNEKILSRTPGVERASVNYATHRARISWDPSVTGLDRIIKRIQSIGYVPKPYSASGHIRAREAERRNSLIKLGTAFFLSSQLMIYSIALYAGYFQGMDSFTRKVLEVIAMALTAPVIFYSGSDFFRSTASGLRHLRFNMDSLISIGSLSAFIYSIYAMATGGEVYFDTASMIVTLILLGRYIELTAKGKASEAIDRLIGLNPKEARVVTGPSDSPEAKRIKTPISAVKKGDLVEVSPGERVPLDGIVVRGNSEADESLITGESRPVAKETGSKVIGGSINLYGSIIFEVTATGEDTVLSGIIRAVEDAQASKPLIQGTADRVVGVFVPAILILGLATAIWNIYSGAPTQKALMTGISVLVIACPCSLGLATPLAVLIFTGMASLKGVLIRSGDTVEKAARLTDVLFDKTGTLTQGRPDLREVIVIDSSLGSKYILGLAASIERLSEHSIGHAVLKAESELENSTLLDVTGFLAVPGRGVRGTADGKDVFIGNRLMMIENGITIRDELEARIKTLEGSGETIVYIGWMGELRAVMAITDTLRDEAVESVECLKKMGICVGVLSGDNEGTTRSIASKGGIGEIAFEASPETKSEKVRHLQNDGRRVMMVGDGINDAPALTQSDVGIAMGRGTDIAIESAEAVMLRNDLRLVPYLVGLSKKSYSIIRQNIFWAFIYNILAIPLAAAGLLHPIIAAAAMAASSLFVVGNSLRIRKYR